MELKNYKKLKKIVISILLAAPAVHLVMFFICTFASLDVAFFTNSLLLKLCMYFIIFVIGVSALENIKLIQHEKKFPCIPERR